MILLTFKSLRDFDESDNKDGIRQIEFIIINAFVVSMLGKIENTSKVKPIVYNDSNVNTLKNHVIKIEQLIM